MIIAQWGFMELRKRSDGTYYIARSGAWVENLYASSDNDAIVIFHDYRR